MKKLVLLIALTFSLSAQEGKPSAPPKDMTGWMWANFAILCGAIYYLSKKYGSPYFTARTEGIRKDIVDAEKTKREADAKISEVNAKLANLGSEIEALRVESRREQNRETERRQSRNQAETARVHEQAVQEIQSATKAARFELQRQAAALALDLAEKKVAARMNPAVQHELASGFVEGLL